MNHRRRKRSRGHAEAEASAVQQGGPGRAPLDHPLVPKGDPELIRDPRSLEGFLEHARAQPAIAFDTEFIGEESFRPRICLVQLATTERVALIDPFEIQSLEPVWELIADERILTIVHAGEQDVEAVRQATGRQPANMVDTQVAASMAGLPWPTSLGTMVERICGHRPSKAHTFTNWDARPLTPSQLRYAADDVRYLPLAWSLLAEELKRRGRYEWSIRESEEVLAGELVFDPSRQVRRAARGEPLRPAALTMLRELIVLRHAIARRVDLPPRAVLPDAVAVEIVKRAPTTRTQLGAVRGMPRPTLTGHGDEILAVIERSKALPPERHERARLLDDAVVRAEIDALWLAFQAKCLAMGLAPNLVTSRSVFTEWCAGRIAARRASEQTAPRGGAGDAKESAKVVESTEPLFSPEDWRHAAVGEWLDHFVRGEATLSIGWRNGLVEDGAASRSAKAARTRSSPPECGAVEDPRCRAAP